MLETQLGFGCASILGKVGKQDSLYALKVAYEAGISYFDIARSYGWGEAEALLGKFLIQEKISRETVEITTKFGQTPRNNKFIRIAKTLARSFVSRVPQTQTIVKSAASQVAPKIDFTVQNAISSLDTSLKALRTDYIDNILFHGYNFENESNEILEVIEFLEAQKKSGKIRNYGFATYASLELLDNFFVSKNIKPDLLQIACGSIGQHNQIHLKTLADKNIKIVMHSPFRISPTIPFMFEQIMAKNLCPEVESIFGRKINCHEDMYEILLSYFQTVYSPYAIVISMFNADHIQKNQQANQERKITKEQFKFFEKLLVFNKIIIS
ncbi:aldo/keto reductase [Nodularia sp. UHCC 0506]|uniref:aldo/keto reductase n=1 Tax=Nodularia sp. UHCC 0506 TaxID=3110243 RepID=UPI002B2071FF|nr:aldo/keto reductase [Nodularia sp. UHCC 0506]MEA5516920.1 aldo/keto reductase [Nodularia sp. UHCC 0506]